MLVSRVVTHVRECVSEDVFEMWVCLTWVTTRESSLIVGLSSRDSCETHPHLISIHIWHESTCHINSFTKAERLIQHVISIQSSCDTNPHLIPTHMWYSSTSHMNPPSWHVPWPMNTHVIWIYIAYQYVKVLCHWHTSRSCVTEYKSHINTSKHLCISLSTSVWMSRGTCE